MCYLFYGSDPGYKLESHIVSFVLQTSFILHIEGLSMLNHAWFDELVSFRLLFYH